MKVIVEFAPIDIEIDEQTFAEYNDHDELAIEEIKEEIRDTLHIVSVPPIAYVREIKKR